MHIFRKTVGTAVDRSHGTRDAAAQLGHTSEAITTRHYVERESVGPDVTEVLERFVPGGKQSTTSATAA